MFIEKMKILLGIYKSGREYLVKTKYIKVNPEWRKTRIGEIKFRRKMGYWLRTGNFESRIILDRDFNLLDGYSSVRIAEIKRLRRVPVYFVD